MQVLFNDTVVTLDVARTHAEQSTGLSNRSSLAPNTGMIFWFPWDVQLAFTVSSMKFPIDMLFLDREFRVVWVFENARPGDKRPFKPPVQYRYVIEVPAGFFARNRTDQVAIASEI